MYNPSFQPLNAFIDDKTIKLPRFQRKKTWKNKQKFDLTLSIYSGYPIGVVILYKEHEKSKVKYLLDGRQRRDAATEIYYNPTALMDWAFKELKLSKDDNREDVLRKFAARVEGFIEQEPRLDEEENDSWTDNDYDESDEYYSEDSEISDDSVERSYYNIDNFANFREMIAIAWTNKKGSNNGLCAPFELSEYFGENKPDYYSSEGKKIDGVKLRRFLKRYKEDNYDDYTDLDCFIKYLKTYINPKNEQALINEKLSGFWEIMVKIIDLLSDLEEHVSNAKLSTIEVSNMSMTDAQKIFNLINDGGTKLAAIEVLSANPGWSKPVDEPSGVLIDTVNKLYRKLEIDNENTVVRWDVASSFVRRINHIDIVFPITENDSVEALTKQATYGFQLLSGVYKKSITKIDYETLYKNPDINWSEGIDNLVEDFSKMLQIVSDTDYFYIFQTWKTSLSKVLSDGCAIDFLLELFFDWKRKGKPTNKSDAAFKAFKRNIFIVTDRLVYEYYSGLWRGSSDSKIGTNLKHIDKMDVDKMVFDHIDNSSWSQLIDNAFDISKTGKYGEYAPLLFHFVCINKIKALNMEDAKKPSIDHIIPQAAWKSSILSGDHKNKMDNIFNLALVDAKINSVKNEKKLTSCEGEEQYIIDSIVKYEDIKAEDFEKYSNPVNWEALREERLGKYRATFVGDESKKSARDVNYLEEV